MADVEQHQATGTQFPRGTRRRSAPHRPQDHRDSVPQNLGVLPPAPNGQLEGHMRSMGGMAHVQPVTGIAGPGIPHDPRYADIAYHDMEDYLPQPLREPPIPYVFPDVGVAQGVPPLGPPNAPNQEHDMFDFVPQLVPPFLAEAALPDPFAHGIPAPGQPAAEHLRRLAIRFLHQPDSLVNLVSMEPGAGGLCKVVIVVEVADILGG